MVQIAKKKTAHSDGTDSVGMGHNGGHIRSIGIFLLIGLLLVMMYPCKRRVCPSVCATKCNIWSH